MDERFGRVPMPAVVPGQTGFVADVTGITSLPRVLVLAAGAGSRMGGPKIFAEIHQRPFGFHIARTLAQLGWPSTWVLRDASQAVRAPWLAALQSAFAVNPEGDMFSSVQAGLFSLSGVPPDAFFIWPVDFPLVRPETLLQLEKTLREGYDAVFPADAGGATGHPPCVRRHTLARWVSSLPVRGGLRAAMASLSCRTARVFTSDRACFLNLNTPADIRSFGEAGDA